MRIGHIDAWAKANEFNATPVRLMVDTHEFIKREEGRCKSSLSNVRCDEKVHTNDKTVGRKHTWTHTVLPRNLRGTWSPFSFPIVCCPYCGQGENSLRISSESRVTHPAGSCAPGSNRRQETQNMCFKKTHWPECTCT